MSANPMDSRRSQVLVHLIEDYIATAEPVGSQVLVEDHDLNVSPATIRHWLAELEEEGYLSQPHASAGRIPSERAYRWYVHDELHRESIRIKSGARARRDASALERALGDDDAVTSNIKAAAKTAAALVGCAAIAGLGRSDSYYTGIRELFGQPEFEERARMVSLGEALDRLDEELTVLRRASYEEPTVFIGRECPFGSECAAIMLTLPEDALLVFLGPMRMPYRHALEVMDTVQRLFQQA
jgi:transcriptional regulator of heat shock response